MDTISLKDYSPINNEDHKTYCKALQDCIDDKQYSITVLNESEERDEKSTITVFDTFANAYYTQKYVGVLFHDEKRLVIQSRFDDDDKQYFLNYVFCKAFNLHSNIFKEMNPLCDTGETWNILLIILFFEKLEQAFKKGYYKEYRKIHYNDAKLKGPINIARHIKENMLFSGNIAYSRRENTINNPLNALILTVIKYINIKYDKFSQTILQEKKFLKDSIQELSYRIPAPQLENKREIVKNTNKAVTRHLFKEYENVRVLARLILKNMGMNVFDTSQNDVTGILINMEKLWENFLEQTFVDVSFLQGKNMLCSTQGGEGLKILFPEGQNTNHLHTLKPDFLLKSTDEDARNIAILDAKYKEYIKDNNEITSPDVKRNDIFQVLTYKLAFNVASCGVIFPTTEKSAKIEAYRLLQNDDAPCFYAIPVVVPQSVDDFSNFCSIFDTHIFEQKEAFYQGVRV